MLGYLFHQLTQQLFMNAIAYRATNSQTQEVLFEGIVNYMSDTIYPAQVEPSLREEFPTLPYEVELQHFSILGITMEIFEFSISFEEIVKYKV